jgi:hypothetical protein
MKQYQVTFHYSLVVEAEEENEAEDYAYAFFTEKLISSGLSSRDFPATTEKIED